MSNIKLLWEWVIYWAQNKDATWEINAAFVFFCFCLVVIIGRQGIGGIW